MPLCTLHLVRLVPKTSIATFLNALLSHPSHRSEFQLVTAAQVRHPIIRATVLDTTLLSSTPWHLVLLLAPPAATTTTPPPPPPTTFQPDIESLIATKYTVYTGIPTKLIQNYTTSTTLNAQPAPPLTALDASTQSRITSHPTDTRASPTTPTSTTAASPARTSQNLELSPDLVHFASHLHSTLHHTGSVTMLNLMHFHPASPTATQNYHLYGQAFAQIGGSKGGHAKVVGRVVPPPPSSRPHSDSRGATRAGSEAWWDECSLVHYPSIAHFCDMAADQRYQDVNRKYRLGALRDTTLICTTEIDLTTLPARSTPSKL